MTASRDVLRYRAAPSATRGPPPGWPSDEENKPPSFAWANGPALASACACPLRLQNLPVRPPRRICPNPVVRGDYYPPWRTNMIGDLFDSPWKILIIARADSLTRGPQEMG